MVLFHMAQNKQLNEDKRSTYVCPSTRFVITNQEKLSNDKAKFRNCNLLARDTTNNTGRG
jgi:hypothetical protein